MKKLLIALVIAVVSLGAVDLNGKIGMGLGFAPDGEIEGIHLPVIDIAVTRYGLSPTMAIEPIFQFTMQSVGNGDTETYTNIKLAGLINHIMMGHQKTNVYLKGGLGLGIASSDAPETEISFELPFGFGLEHFVSEHFSINLAAISGFKYISNPQGYEGSNLVIKLGNDKPFAFYLLWYY